MPETVPRWLLAGAGIVALLIVLVEVKDYAERKSASNSPGSSTSTTVPPDVKSTPKTTGKTRRARVSADAAVDSEAESDDAADALENASTMGGIEQASERTGELALRSGDQLVVPQRSWASRNTGVIIAAVGAVTSIAWLVTRNY